MRYHRFTKSAERAINAIAVINTVIAVFTDKDETIIAISTANTTTCLLIFWMLIRIITALNIVLSAKVKEGNAVMEHKQEYCWYY